MATDPAFSSGIAIGSGLLPATLDTSLTAPTNTTVIVNNVQSTLSSALVSGTAYTSLSVTATPRRISAGDVLQIGSGATTQQVVASAAAALGATSISVVSFVANAAYGTSGVPVCNLTNGGLKGSQVFELDFVGVGTTVAGVINVFLYDGTTYYLRDQVLVTATTSSTTAVAFKATNTYPNLFIPNGWKLVVTGTVSGNQSLVCVTANGGDL